MDVTKLNKDEMLSNVAELLSDVEESNESLKTQNWVLLILLSLSTLLNLI